jgi:hypothetical protein
MFPFQQYQIAPNGLEIGDTRLKSSGIRQFYLRPKEQKRNKVMGSSLPDVGL